MSEHEHNQEEKHEHVTEYSVHGIILVVLLVLTFITVFVANINFGIFSVAVALLVASIKGTTVISYFMHLKHENRFMQLIVAGVFLLYALVLVITFFDYSFR